MMSALYSARDWKLVSLASEMIVSGFHTNYIHKINGSAASVKHISPSQFHVDDACPDEVAVEIGRDERAQVPRHVGGQ